MAISIILLIASFSVGIAASFYSSRLSISEDRLKSAKTSPASLPQMNKELKLHIDFLQSGCIILGIVGSIFLLVALGIRFNVEKISNVIVSCLLMFLLLLSLPIVQATPNIADRWYGSLFLLQPRTSLGVRGNIFFYSNSLDPNYEYSFVAFRLMLVRIDLVYYEQEWLEVGYFQNRSGYWIYGASYSLDRGYTVTDYMPLTEPLDANHFGIFSIVHITGNKFQAFLEGYGVQSSSQPIGTESIQPEALLPPEQGGAYPIHDVTFTINSDNFYHGASESNDDLNSLTAFYSELRFYDNGWQAWTNISPEYDSPYMVQLGSTDKFHTYRVGQTGMRFGGAGGGYITMTDIPI